MDGNILTENAHIAMGLVPDSRALNGSSDVINISLHHSLTFLLVKGPGAVGTTTLTVEACDTVGPGNTAAIPFQYRRQIGGTDTWGALTVATAVGFVTTAHIDDIYEISVDPAEVTNAVVNAARGNHFVRLTMTQVNATECDCCILVILPRQRYKQQVPITVLV